MFVYQIENLTDLFLYSIYGLQLDYLILLSKHAKSQPDKNKEFEASHFCFRLKLYQN